MNHITLDQFRADMQVATNQNGSYSPEMQEAARNEMLAAYESALAPVANVATSDWLLTQEDILRVSATSNAAFRFNDNARVILYSHYERLVNFYARTLARLSSREALIVELNSGIARAEHDRDRERIGLRERIAELETERVEKNVRLMEGAVLIAASMKLIAELEAAQRWIPASERKPDNELNVLTWNLDFEEELRVAYYLHGKWVEWSNMMPGADMDEPTHWQPLPPFPETLLKETK